MAPVDILGAIAGVVTTLTFLPQVIKTWRDKSVKDISGTMFIIAAVNELMWIGYALWLDPPNWVIFWTNAILFVMASTMLFFKLKYADRDGSNQDLNF